jgi:predicted Zn-dependent peptidase
MKIDTATLKGLHGRHVEKTGERIALLSFSTRVQRAHSAREETIRLVYAEALLSGAGIYSRAKFLDTLSTLGSSITVGADVDAIHISMYALDTTCKSTLALFEALFSKPHFDQKELIRIKEYLKNALILAEEDARARAYQNFSNALTDIHDPQYVFPIDEILKQLSLCFMLHSLHHHGCIRLVAGK